MPAEPAPPPQGWLANRLGRLLMQAPNYLRALRLIWSAGQGLTVAWGLLLVVQGLLPAGTVYLTKLLVDSLVAARGRGLAAETLTPLLWQAGLMAFLLLLGELLQALLEWVRAAQAERVGDTITDLVQRKSAEVDLAFYDSPEYYDHLHRARSDAAARSLALLENSGGLIQNSITLAAMAAVLLPYGLWLPLVLVIGTLPALLVVVQFNARYHTWWRRTTADRRWTQYYDLVLTSSNFAAELRLFRLGDYFRGLYRDLRLRLRGERLDLLRSQSLARLGAGMFALLASAAALAYIIVQALNGALSLGDIALFYQAYSRGESLMRSLLGSLGQIYANSLFLSNLFEFLELPTQVEATAGAPAPALRQGVSFDAVSFAYPGSQRRVLEGFNASFPAGKITALVGPNGAGKSTLVRLLCRFYDPDAGRVALDGEDLRQFSLDALRRQITVLFQTPVAYYASAGENIRMGDRQADDSPPAIETAARAAGAHEVILRLPQGYETFLGRLFAGGAELSVGEWQRVALARAFWRDAPLMILDEPTSAMDPWAEADWMQRFRGLAQGKTAIIITHRFTTARHADQIYVMQAGQIVESGSHAELLEQGGVYAQSWRTQTETQSS